MASCLTIYGDDCYDNVDNNCLMVPPVATTNTTYCTHADAKKTSRLPYIVRCRPINPRVIELISNTDRHVFRLFERTGTFRNEEWSEHFAETLPVQNQPLFAAQYATTRATDVSVHAWRERARVWSVGQLIGDLRTGGTCERWGECVERQLRRTEDETRCSATVRNSTPFRADGTHRWRSTQHKWHCSNRSIQSNAANSTPPLSIALIIITIILTLSRHDTGRL